VSAKEGVLDVFSNHSVLEVGPAKLQAAFDVVYKNLNSSFDLKAFEIASEQFRAGLRRYQGTDAYSAYTYYPDRPHCDLGVRSAPKRSPSGVSPFPGGPISQLIGRDFAKEVHDLSREASGPATAGLASAAALNTQNLKLGMGMVQSVIAALVHTIPPLVPPPTWNNQPCLALRWSVGTIALEQFCIRSRWLTSLWRT